MRAALSGRRFYVVMALVPAAAQASLPSAAPPTDYPIVPVPFTQVRIQGGFWGPRLETNRRVTVRYDFAKCEETGRIANFARAGDLEPGEFEGIFFNDSDVFKVIEGASYSLHLAPDVELERYLDELIAKIAAAQEADGYLYTARTLRPDHPPDGSGGERWSRLSTSHELYNVGHLYEAAVAHWQATGKTLLLDVARKNADLIDSVFGPDGRHDVPGHEEIEIGLVKLYRATHERRYLDLARFFIDQRGRPEGRSGLYGEAAQDHLPVVEQRHAVGHAVRAGYLYSGVADVAALTGDANYRRMLDRIWNDVVGSKLYITGGIGSRPGGEAFGDPFELPNATAYNETCAAIANALWNQRMFLLNGDSKYIDVLERILYNGFLAGVSLSGDRFFYPNPLAADGRTAFNHGAAERQPWFDCACCPVNVVRFLPSIAGQVFAVRETSLYVNLYTACQADLEVGGTSLRLKQETDYPWSGDIRVTVVPVRPTRFALRLRIPGWARGEPVPGELYRELNRSNDPPRIELAGNELPVTMDKGYAAIDRTWQAGDQIVLRLPLNVRRVLASERVEANRGRVAIERGPLVYAFEGVDHGGSIDHLVLDDSIMMRPRHRGDLLGGITVLEGEAVASSDVQNDPSERATITLTAIPYHLWCHRGPTPMAVWIPRTNRK